MENDDALIYAKENKKKLLNNLIKDKIASKNEKTAIFMAGSPGAGKSEVATSIVEIIDDNLVLIDADDFRSKFPDYTGTNASDFQRSASWLVDYSFSYLLQHSYSIILDATFTSNKAFKNIERAINRGYQVSIFIVYQKPEIAWDFVKAREKIGKRVVPQEVFKKSFDDFYRNIKEVLNKFRDEISLNVINKNYQNDTTHVITNLKSIENFENNELMANKKYDKETINEIVNKYDHNYSQFFMNSSEAEFEQIINYIAQDANSKQIRITIGK